MTGQAVPLREEAPRQSGAVAQPLPGECEAPLIADWLHVEQDGTVIVYTGKAEVGQQIRTSLAQAVAEELRLPLQSIRMVMADTGRTPYDMGTFGSRTTPVMAAHLRKVAASAREWFLSEAAAQLGVPAHTLDLTEGRITDPASGRQLALGDISRGKKLAHPYTDDAPLTPPGQWQVSGSDALPVKGGAIVTGRHEYTPDLTRPGMLTGMVLRPPAFGATLESLDARAAESLPGVTVVHEADFVGVAAPTRQSALAALAALRAEWRLSPSPAIPDLPTHLKENLVPPEDEERYAAARFEEFGSIEAGRAAADLTLSQRYSVAYIAHAPLEPRAALAEWSADRLTVWTGTQRPFGVRTELAAAFDLDESQARVIVPDTGSAYGGKHTGEVAIEAARLARAAGQPVKLVWSREEEFTWAYFRPAGLIEINSGVLADGTLTSWEVTNYNSGAASLQTPYDVPHHRSVFHPANAPLREGSYRALAATANTFARESHMDELAYHMEQDPLEFRLHNLRDERLRVVLQAAAEQFGWDSRSQERGRGAGIACGAEKGGYVATCAEVAVDERGGLVRVTRVVQAFECGAIVNPDGLRSQVEGSIIQGLGGALWEATHFANGRILTNRFSSYRVPRFADIPRLDVILIDRPDLASAGGSETPIIGIAPAIGNAIFAATGLRLRSLPLAPNGKVIASQA